MPDLQSVLRWPLRHDVGADRPLGRPWDSTSSSAEVGGLVTYVAGYDYVVSAPNPRRSARAQRGVTLSWRSSVRSLKNITDGDNDQTAERQGRSVTLTPMATSVL